MDTAREDAARACLYKLSQIRRRADVPPQEVEDLIAEASDLVRDLPPGDVVAELAALFYCHDGIWALRVGQYERAEGSLGRSADLSVERGDMAAAANTRRCAEAAKFCGAMFRGTHYNLADLRNISR